MRLWSSVLYAGRSLSALLFHLRVHVADIRDVNVLSALQQQPKGEKNGLHTRIKSSGKRHITKTCVVFKQADDSNDGMDFY